MFVCLFVFKLTLQPQDTEKGIEEFAFVVSEMNH